MFSCFICDSNFEVVNHLVIHLNIYHDIKAISEFICKVSNCFRSFGTLNSFKKHLNIHNCIPTQSVHYLNLNKSSNTSTLKSTYSIDL